MSTTALFAPDSPSESLLITAEEFGRLLGISERSIWRLNSAGHVPKPVRIGGSVRWRRNDVMDWIHAGCPTETSRDNASRRK